MIKTFYGIGERSGPSDHPVGKAVDIMIPDYQTAAGNALGWQIAKWVQANTPALGVTYVAVERTTDLLSSRKKQVIFHVEQPCRVVGPLDHRAQPHEPVRFGPKHVLESPFEAAGFGPAANRSFG